MSLSVFPVELLRDILNGENSWAALELWKAGDRVLNAKLASGGVTDVDLVDNRCDSTSRWPKCLKEFRLERLSITRMNGTLWPLSSLRRELEQLHSGLKVLRIFTPGIVDTIFPSAQLATKENNGDDDDEDEDDQVDENTHNSDEEDAEEDAETSANAQDEAPASKRSKTIDTTSDTTHHTMWDLGRTFPTLERLDLAPKDHIENVYYSTNVLHYDARMLALLPRTLTHLELIYSSLIPDSNLIPPGLKTLRLTPNLLSPKHLRRLPKSITDLHLSVSGQGLALLNDERDLLPNLKSFPHVDFDDRSYDLSEFTLPIYDGDKTWPPMMVEMKVYTNDDSPSIFEQLPRSLTSLNSCCYDETPLLRPAAIQALPRGLVVLQVAEIQWKDIDVSTWPSTLTTLEVQNGRFFGPDRMHMLPRSLKTFGIEEFLNEEDDEDEDEANRLNLDFDALCTLGRESLQADTRWPSIKRDLLKRASSVSNEALESYIVSIESGQLYGLPVGLTSLKLAEPLLPIKVKLLLPPNIATLELQSRGYEAEETELSLLLASFPPTSTAHFGAHLHDDVLPRLRSVDGIPFTDSPTTSGLYTSFIASLKLNLLDSTVADNLIKCLPRSLTVLQLDDMYGQRSFSVNAAALEDLPRNLKSLTFAGVLTNGLASWVQHLPRTLEVLHTPRVAIIGHHINELPQKLKVLECSFFEVSLPQVLDLPKSLVSLTVTKSGAYESTLLKHCLTFNAWKTLISTYRPFWRVHETGVHGMTVELSIASRSWQESPDAHHTGVKDFSSVSADTSSNPTSNDLEIDTSNAVKHDYTCANVESYIVDAGSDATFIDPRTRRRLTPSL